MTDTLAMERRKRQILVTDNSEYYMRGNKCVAVRDCRSGQLYREHQAVGSEVVGRMAFQRDGSWELAVGVVPEEGKCIFFSSHLVTSPLRRVTRLKSEVTAH